MRAFFVALIAVSLMGYSQTPTTTTFDEQIQTTIAHIFIASHPAKLSDALSIAPSKTVIPTEKAAPTRIAAPKATNTPKPSSTPFPSQSVEDLREGFLQAIGSALRMGEGLEDIESVNVIRFNEQGTLEIYLNTIWVSRELQPGVSYDIIRFLAAALSGLDASTANTIASGEFKIQITTYSVNADYRYQSLTGLPTLKKVYNKEISYEKWLTAAGAGFIEKTIGFSTLPTKPAISTPTPISVAAETARPTTGPSPQASATSEAAAAVILTKAATQVAATLAPTATGPIQTTSPSAQAAAYCPKALPSRLEVGDLARLTSNLNMRSSAGILGQVILTKLAGTILRVIGGPVCEPYQGGAYLWWQVQRPDGKTGWSVEGSLFTNFYFLEPVNKAAPSAGG